MPARYVYGHLQQPNASVQFLSGRRAERFCVSPSRLEVSCVLHATDEAPLAEHGIRAGRRPFLPQIHHIEAEGGRGRGHPLE